MVACGIKVGGFDYSYSFFVVPLIAVNFRSMYL